MHHKPLVIRILSSGYFSMDILSRTIDQNIYYLYDTKEIYFHDKKVYIPEGYSGDIYSYISLLRLSLLGSRNKKPIEKYKIELWAYTEGVGLKENGEIVDLHRSEEDAILDCMIYH